MFLFKLFQSFLSPAMLCFLALVAGLILFLKNRALKTAKILLSVAIIILYLFSITPIADLIIAPIENQYQRISSDEANQLDTLVILTGDIDERAPEILRLYFLKQIAGTIDENFKVIITGTDALNPQNTSESRKTKEFLIERGIPAEKVIIEDRSRNTFESARNVEKSIGQGPFILVTSSYHMLRSMYAFEKAGMHPIPAPANFSESEDAYNLFDFLPNPENLKTVNLATHEYLGLLYYKFK
ncbi:MAG: ElyC/SanA/YdcF family protein [Parcubacteria group bacterium]